MKWTRGDHHFNEEEIMIKVYKYGLLAPTSNGDLVHQQMRLAHGYRNELVAIERGRRSYVRGIYAEHGSEPALEQAVADAEAAVEDAERAIKARRAETRSRSEKQAQRDVLREARERLKGARVDLSEYRRKVRKDPAVVTKVAVIDGEKKAPAEGEKLRDSSKPNEGLAAVLRRSARANAAENGLYWGTYLLVEKADVAARSSPLYDEGKPNDPHFARWDGEGLVGVQIQRQSGDPPFGQAELFGDDTRVRIDRVDERAWTSPVRGERRRLSRTVIHLRVGSYGRAPVWASWPMIMHRPLPDGSVVKWVVVGVRRVGPREEWFCDITVDVPELERAPASGPSVAAAVHLGWLSTPRGLRVATWMDTTGETGELVIGNGDLETTDIDSGRGGILSGVRKADDIRSIRDKNFNAVLDLLVAWLRGHDMPEWMRALTMKRGTAIPSKAQALAYLSGWRSPTRLASLAKRWRDARFDGDNDAFLGLESWRYHDYHLWQWEANQRLSALRRRREVYRRVAAKLAERYDTVLVDGVRLDGIAKRKRTEDGPDIDASRSNRQAAAVSEFRNVLENAVKSRGGKVEKVDAAKASITCPACGESHPAQQDADAHAFACHRCDFIGDADDVARYNMLIRGGFEEAVRVSIAKRKELAAALGRHGGDAHV